MSLNLNLYCCLGFHLNIKTNLLLTVRRLHSQWCLTASSRKCVSDVVLNPLAYAAIWRRQAYSRTVQTHKHIYHNPSFSRLPPLLLSRAMFVLVFALHSAIGDAYMVLEYGRLPQFRMYICDTQHRKPKLPKLVWII